MPLERGAAARVDVELRHARVVRKRDVDPGALEPTREDEVLGGVDQPLPREVRRGGERGRHDDRERDAGDPSRQEERRGEEDEEEDRERQAARRRPGPGQLRLDPLPERARDGVDPRLVRELPEREDQRERERARRRRSRRRRGAARQAGGEPDDEADEPERDEVEAVAVVEAVVALGRARERGDDEEPGGVGRGEQRDEGARATRPRAPRPGELPEHDGRDGDGHDREVTVKSPRW